MKSTFNDLDTKDISKFVVSRRNFGKIGSRLHFVYRVCLNIS